MATLQQFKRLIRHTRVRQAATVIILVLTVALFIHFFASHPAYLRQLRHISPALFTAIIGVNCLLLLTLVVIYDAILALCGHRLRWKENFMLTAYSSIVNFFGPLQSGPGVRAVYLRTKHGVRIRDYTLGTLLYYAAFATISGTFLLVATLAWWQTTLIVGLIAAASAGVIRLFVGRTSTKQARTSTFQLRPRPLIILLLATLVQVLLVSLAYYLELHSLNRHISYGQAASYTGAANFALFVSLTPGAIGFRESFLYFSERIHHVATATIFSANLIDRVAYVLFLGLVFVVLLSLHAKDRLQLTKLRRQSARPTDDSSTSPEA